MLLDIAGSKISRLYSEVFALKAVYGNNPQIDEQFSGVVSALGRISHQPTPFLMISILILVSSCVFIFSTANPKGLRIAFIVVHSIFVIFQGLTSLMP